MPEGYADARFELPATETAFTRWLLFRFEHATLAGGWLYVFEQGAMVAANAEKLGVYIAWFRPLPVNDQRLEVVIHHRPDPVVAAWVQEVIEAALARWEVTPSAPALLEDLMPEFTPESYRAEYDRLAIRLGKRPTQAELADAFGFDERTLQRRRASYGLPWPPAAPAMKVVA